MNILPASKKVTYKHRRKLVSLIVLFIVAILGIYTKLYSGFADEWVNNSLGGVFYVIFWCQVVHFIWPDSSPFKVSLLVLLATCTIEFTQLSHLAVLESIRKTFPGRALIGNSFTIDDFWYYIAGAFIAWGIQYSIQNGIKLKK